MVIWLIREAFISDSGEERESMVVNFGKWFGRIRADREYSECTYCSYSSSIVFCVPLNYIESVIYIYIIFESKINFRLWVQLSSSTMDPRSNIDIK